MGVAVEQKRRAVVTTESVFPYSRELLAKCCSCCPNCNEHGYLIYREEPRLRLCPHIARCEWCDALLPVDDEHFDEGRPRTYDGMPSCPACIARMRKEDSLTCDPELPTDFFFSYQPTGKSEMKSEALKLGPIDMEFITVTLPRGGTYLSDAVKKVADSQTCDPRYMFIIDETEPLKRK